MGILDEAIREHLELKRQHGAEDTELKQLEDDAFGPPRRPGAAQDPADPASEAATEFMAQPDLGGVGGGDEAEAEEKPPARREPVAEVQEAPAPPEEDSEPADEPTAANDEDEPTAAKDEDEDEPAVEDQPAAEHEAVPSPAPSHTTEERHAIADQPTEMFDVEKEFDAKDAVDPSDEELVAEEIAEPRLAPAEPLDSLSIDDSGEVEIHAADDEEDEDEDDFFDEKRLSEELDQALEAPLEPDSEEAPRSAALEPDSEEAPRPSVVEPDSEEMERGDEKAEADSEELSRPAARDADEDVLEETPDFLEETPEDDQLWFEQKPPKDFDFDD